VCATAPAKEYFHSKNLDELFARALNWLSVCHMTTLEPITVGTQQSHSETVTQESDLKVYDWAIFHLLRIEQEWFPKSNGDQMKIL
jgi:hypothetical protein